jgi:16S rRNA (cytosine1402-N4)-methyltransferase
MVNPDPIRSPHQPVLYQHILDYLKPASPGKYVDGTVGAGGHAAGILAASAPEGLLLGLDVDERAIALARQKTAGFGSRVIIKRASYTSLRNQLEELGWENVEGVLLDLGISSMQLDNAQRGFSFLKEAPLDMRFDNSQKLTAGELVNELSQKELARIIREFGEEPRANQIAAAIVRNRPIQTTTELAALITAVHKGKRGRTNPATKTFQALRMATNDELNRLAHGLEQAIEALGKGGRLAVISFHSLEDRLVKQLFQRESRDCICPPEQVICTCGHHASLKVITKKPVIPSEEEVTANPRSRSAKLRVAQKI